MGGGDFERFLRVGTRVDTVVAYLNHVLGCENATENGRLAGLMSSGTPQVVAVRVRVRGHQRWSADTAEPLLGTKGPVPSCPKLRLSADTWRGIVLVVLGCTSADSTVREIRSIFVCKAHVSDALDVAMSHSLRDNTVWCIF